MPSGTTDASSHPRIFFFSNIHDLLLDFVSSVIADVKFYYCLLRTPGLIYIIAHIKVED